MAAVAVLERARVLRLRVGLEEIEIELHAADEVAERIGLAVAEVVVDVEETDAGAGVRLDPRAAEVDGDVEIGRAGGDVVVVKLNKDGSMKSMEPLITGFLEDNKYIGRPVDVLPMKDGSLLVSDDWNGAVYRITYGKQKVAGKQ